jgi:choline kinase
MSTATTALILAAGMGSRLMPLTAERPKVLVELAGRTLLDRLIDSCKAASMTRAVVVTGYRRDSMRKWLDAGSASLPVTPVHNAEYETINNAHSLWVARDALLGSDFVKLDGDLLLDPAVRTGLLACPWRSAAAIDTTGELDAEAMKATLEATADGARVTALGKWIDIDDGDGESIGIEKIAADDAPALFDAIERVVHREGRHDAYYEDVYHQMIAGGWQLGGYPIGEARWTEIDNHEDLQRATTLVPLLDAALAGNDEVAPG